MIVKTTENNESFEIFDGEIVHPSLDIKNGVMVLGFRYRAKADEEKDMVVIADGGTIRICTDPSFKVADRQYHLEKRKRKLMRIEERWGTAPLLQFVDDYTQARPLSSSKAIFDRIVSLGKKYIELECETDYYLLAAWIVGTYFCPIFCAYPFLHIKAPKRSGKSQCLNFLTQLCFNAVKARPSLAALGDTIDALRGTYLIDQADALGRKGNEELLDILSDSYKKSGGKRRIINFDKGKTRETLEFETYGPKAFASIKELPEDLRDRCLMVPLIRSQRNFPDPDESNEDWREVRGDLYRVLMMDYALIESDYSVKKIGYRQTQEMLGRSLELWLPLEVILDCCGAGNKVAEAKKRFLSQYGFTEYEPSEIEGAVIKAILDRFSDHNEIIITPAEIAETMEPEAFSQGETPKQRAAKVGWAIKKFNVSSEKKPRTKEGVRYRFEKIKVEGIYQSYFKTSADPAPPTQNDSDGLNIEKMVV